MRRLFFQMAVFLFLVLVAVSLPTKTVLGQTLEQGISIVTPNQWRESCQIVVHPNGDYYVISGFALHRYSNNFTYKATYCQSADLLWSQYLAVANNGDILVSDTWHGRILRVSPDGAVLSSNILPFVSPSMVHGVVQSANEDIFYSTNSDLNRFVVTSVSTIGNSEGGLQLIQTMEGNLAVACQFIPYAKVYSQNGEFKGLIGPIPLSGRVGGVAQGSDGSFWLSDMDHGTVHHFSSSNLLLETIGPLLVDGSTLKSPRGLFIDQNGTLFVCDVGAGNIRLFTKPTPPTSNFTPTSSTAWSNTDVSASITSTDNTGGSGVKEIHYSINMGTKQVVTGSSASFTLSENGIQSIAYYAVDIAGNTETTQYATVKIDKIAPVTTLSRNGGLITLSASDAHSGVAKIKYQINGGAVADYSVPFADTVHKVTYWAEDIAGNVEAAKTDIINAGIQSISVTQPRLNGGTGVVGTITLDKAAGVGGTVIILASSLPGVAFVDPSVTVPEGATTATFDIDANPVAIDTSVSITASIYETSQIALVTVLAPMPSSISWSVSPVIGGTATTGTLTLTSPAPTGGTTVSLASSSLSAIVGSSVTIPAGAMTATFTVSTNAVSNDYSAVISATVYGVKLKSTLGILGPKVTSVTLASASIASTTTTTGTVTLTTNAPLGGKVVTLSSSNSAVASVPVSVTVAAGTRTATFTVTAGTVIANTNATITATTNGSSGTATITVTPPAAVLSTLTTVVTAVTGGVPVTGTVTLTSPAPTGGAVVTLASSSTTIGTVPASVTVAAGATTATFTITTSAVTAASSLTITATRSGVSKSATVMVNPVRVVSTLTLNPTSVKGGTNITGTVTLSGIATEAVVVTLTSGTTAVARVPASVTVPAGSTTATFTITTLTQTSTRTSIITARTGTTSRTATLSVTR